MKLIDQITSPEDIKQMDMATLKILAHEIRQRLVQVTAKNGGHLAPNLGVVELTLALHYVYDAPKDKIVWDVGHQAYVHKILTGRADAIDTVRTYGGLSGFPKRSESDYDAFGTGHSSTSISAAVGFALARDRRGEDHEVVAVIGDGAMTGGMAYEALNSLGQMKSKMTIILNDNEMSIAPNVGGLAEYLNRVRTDPKYVQSKEDIELLLKKIPSIGDKMVKAADRLKDSFKYLLVPGTIFEELGIKYFGPVNGHDLPEMIKVLENAKQINKPIIIHVITQKGKGYAPAETNPDKFHGVSPFDIATGQVLSHKKAPAYTDVFADTLIRLGREDERIMGITAAMGLGTGVSKFADEFPKRVVDVGIAEEHAVTMAAAMALDGLKPVVAIYSTFLQRAYDQLIHDVALQQAPVVFAIDRAGLVGDDGPTHHGVFDLAYLRQIPNMIVMAPKDENELQHMLYTALDCGQPAAVRYPRGEGLGVPMDDKMQKLAIGKGELLADGGEIILLAVGSMVAVAEEAAQLLERRYGLKTTLINARFVKPLDEELILTQAAQKKLVVTMEEGILAGGFGSAVLELLNAKGQPMPPVLRIGIEDGFVAHGATERLKEDCGLTAEKITARIAQTLSLTEEGEM